MHRTLACLVPLALALATPRTAQGQGAPAYGALAPLEHPRAPGALRGMSVCLAPAEDAGSRRVANYLARLLEGAGAGVAIAPRGAVAEPPIDVARAAGAALLLELDWADGADAAVRLPPRADDDPLAVFERDLAGRWNAAAPRGSVGGAAPPPLPTVAILVGGDRGPQAHRAPTGSIFDAVVAWWRDHGGAVRARSAAWAVPTATTPRASDRLWPFDRPPSDEAEVAAFLHNWRSARVADGTQVYLRVEVRKVGDGWEFGGATELPALEGAVRRALDGAGVRPLRGGLRLLPDSGRLGPSAFGVVRSRAALTWRVPGRATGLARIDPAGQVEETELLQGEPLLLLDRESGHLLVHAPSGYLGWVREDVVRSCDEAEFRACVAGAIASGDGAGDVGESVARLAASRLGTPYVFGGRGGDGIDCSGLVETSWGAQGVFLPRDAKQQILCGRLVATARRPAPLEPGDLLFFANAAGAISHVGLSLGGFRFVHATPPEVTVASLDPEDPWYSPVAERFVLAKRVAR